MILGIDIGGTKIAAGLVSLPDGKVSEWRQIPTNPRRGGEAILGDVERLAGDLAGVAEVEAIGISICELVSLNGELLTHGTIPWRGMEVQRRLARFGRVRFEADVRAAALAEARFGAGQEKRVFLYVTIGTGISSCLVIEGKPCAGARGAAGTFGSGPMPAFAPPLEEIASGPALAKRCNVATAEEVFARAEQGDAHASQVLREAAARLGAAVGWLVSIVDPELVVVGGGIGLRAGLFRDALIAATRPHIWWPEHRELPIVSAATGAAAAVIGAALAAKET